MATKGGDGLTKDGLLMGSNFPTFPVEEQENARSAAPERLQMGRPVRFWFVVAGRGPAAVKRDAI
jgi:hypothetical protein